MSAARECRNNSDALFGTSSSDYEDGCRARFLTSTFSRRRLLPIFLGSISNSGNIRNNWRRQRLRRRGCDAVACAHSPRLLTTAEVQRRQCPIRVNLALLIIEEYPDGGPRTRFW